MSNIPFPIERKNALTVADPELMTVFAAAAIQALAKTGRSSAVIWEGKPPALPYRTETWDLLEVNDEFLLPIEVQRRINILRNNNIPIKRILIAHEHPSEEQRLLEATRREEIERTTSSFLRGVAWVTVALAIGVAVVAALPVVLAVVGVIGGLMLVGNGLDPAVVCVLDDGSDSWLLCGYWFE